jgi:hypothetical protein
MGDPKQKGAIAKDDEESIEMIFAIIVENCPTCFDAFFKSPILYDKIKMKTKYHTTSH